MQASPGPRSLAEFTVGTVVRATRAEAVEYYVVLADGVQRIGAVAADLIRFSDSQSGREIATVSPDTIGAAPAVDSLPLADLPDHAHTTMGAVGHPVLCAHWRPNREVGEASTAVLVGDSLPLGGSGPPVTLAQADADGPNIDSVYLSPGRSGYVRSVGITGSGGSSGSLFLVNDFGVRFGIHDEDAAKHLGLPSTPLPAPWPVLALLPRGPELSVQHASVRDGVAPPS